ncbi:MAG: sugar kinase [Rhizobacter sp.]|nr:sugar kinase [Burkholderiales bacterium]
MPDILSLGEPMWEMNAIPAEPGKYLLGYGGDTANFCIAAARQGANVGYITRVGSDAFGDGLRALWQHERVDCSQVSVDPSASTGGYFVHHGPTGHHFSYARAGSAATKLSPSDIDDNVVERAQFVHSSGITQAISTSARAAALKLFQVARQAGVSTAFDANFRPRLWTVDEARDALAAVLPLTDFFFPSIEDASALSGVTDHDEIFRWAHALGAQVVLLKLGVDGVKISQGAGSDVMQMASFSVDTVDATGAGDCFAGATIARLAMGELLLDAVRYANAAAALTTTQFGAINAIPARDVVKSFLQSRV